MRLVADPLAQRRQSARLADAGLAREQRDLAFALRRVTPAVEEQRHLMLAPDERRQALRPRRLKPAEVLGLAQNHPGGNRRVEAFQHLRPKRRQLECPAKQSPRRLRDDHASRLSERLQSRRQIGGLADHGLFLR